MPIRPAPIHVRRVPAKEHTSHPPVILIHGFAADGDTDWIRTGFADALAASGHETWIPDLRGHGSSPAPASPDEATTTALLADVIALIDEAEADQVDVVGYSLGARLAWELPAASSGRVRRLILGGLSPFEPFAAVDLPALKLLADRDSGNHTTPADPLTEVIARMITAPGRNTAGLIRCIQGLSAEPFVPSQGQPAVPTLFVAGKQDVMTAGVDDLLQLLPGVKLTTVPGDHLGALGSAEFRSAAVSFLA